MFSPIVIQDVQADANAGMGRRYPSVFRCRQEVNAGDLSVGLRTGRRTAAGRRFGRRRRSRAALPAVCCDQVRGIRRGLLRRCQPLGIQVPGDGQSHATHDGHRQATACSTSGQNRERPYAMLREREAPLHRARRADLVARLLVYHSATAHNLGRTRRAHPSRTGPSRCGTRRETPFIYATPRLF